MIHTKGFYPLLSIAVFIDNQIKSNAVHLPGKRSESILGGNFPLWNAALLASSDPHARVICGLMTVHHRINVYKEFIPIETKARRLKCNYSHLFGEPLNVCIGFSLSSMHWTRTRYGIITCSICSDATRT